MTQQQPYHVRWHQLTEHSNTWEKEHVFVSSYMRADLLKVLCLNLSFNRGSHSSHLLLFLVTVKWTTRLQWSPLSWVTDKSLSSYPHTHTQGSDRQYKSNMSQERLRKGFLFEAGRGYCSLDARAWASRHRLATGKHYLSGPVYKTQSGLARHSLVI